MLTFTTFGIAAPKGSAKAFYRPGMRHAVVTHDSARTKPWQHCVVAAARDALAGAPPLQGPVHVRVEFYMPRPKSAPKRITLPATRPDVDKLLRCVLDALTRAGVYGDDGQVVETTALKRFAGDQRDVGGTPRAVVTVQPLSADVLSSPASLPLFGGEGA
jgi:Holliday junction resolvase RusA-like endonuclease